MTVEPRAALDRLVAALEAHYNAVATRRSDDDPAVDDAYDVLADAYEVYEDALATQFGEVTPFYLAEDLDDEDDDDEDDGEEDLDYDFEDELGDVENADDADDTTETADASDAAPAR